MGKNTLINPFRNVIRTKGPDVTGKTIFFRTLLTENQYPKTGMLRNWVDRLSRLISPGSVGLPLHSFISFCVQQVASFFSITDDAREEKPTTINDPRTRRAKMPGSIQFFFFISAGLEMGRK